MEQISDNTTKETKLILLGTGTPNAYPERSGSSIAIIVNSKPYFVDFGPGVVRRAVKAKLDPKLMHIAFLTHLHTDHTAGYPDIIFTPWILGREKALTVYGPPGLKHMSEKIHEAYQADILERLDGLEPANLEGHKVVSQEVRPGTIFQNDDLKVEAFEVNHGSWVAYGYKFHTSNRVIVISGDTAPSRNLEEFSKGCDIMIHEVYSAENLKKRPQKWQKYHKKVHTSTYELGRIASRVQPKLLVLYHQLFWGATDEELIREVKQYYDGEIVSGKDLDIF